MLTSALWRLLTSWIKKKDLDSLNFLILESENHPSSVNLPVAYERVDRRYIYFYDHRYRTLSDFDEILINDSTRIYDTGFRSMHLQIFKKNGKYLCVEKSLDNGWDLYANPIVHRKDSVAQDTFKMNSDPWGFESQ